ncbi:MAG TPA: hypothetical protein VGN20_10785 [Mucilaginibacter sp.]|jgi:hypothetical protein
MSDFRSGYIIAYHGCDREVGLRLINGADELKPSTNKWDWLGEGIYFWEEDPARAIHYSEKNALGKQKNKVRAKTPFVVGAIIEPGNCLNLVEVESVNILTEAYDGLKQLIESSGETMPVNTEQNRSLDCAVINYIHQVNEEKGLPSYDSIRCAFPEGDPAFPGSKITSLVHIQVCLRNPEQIKGYFLPRPINKYNPNIK